MEKLKISKESPKELLKKKNQIFNFINLEGVYFYNKNKNYKKALDFKYANNFADGAVLSLIKGVRQQRGPSFTKEFLESLEAKTEKHFFITSPLNTKEEIVKFSKISKEKIFVHTPSYIKGFDFSKREIEEIALKIKKFNPKFVWVGIGAPKQEILSYELYKRFKANYINIGAGLDFFTQKKKAAPKFFQKAKMEWFYRLITDFKHVKPKVLRSFYGLYKIK